MKRHKIRWIFAVLVVFLLVFFSAQSSMAVAMYIAGVSSFPAYDYNKFSNPPGYTIGCGPTTGAMIVGYFENYYGATGILKNGNGFDTAVALHSDLNTNASGFGSPYDIKPGMESYALGQGYDINVMVHVGTWNSSSSTAFDDYGSYGDGWNNDGTFWRDLGGGNYTFDDLDFYNFSVAKLNAGIPVWLAIDQDSTEGGDHWVPMIGVEWFDAGYAEYIYFDTYGLTEQRAAVRYIQDTLGGGDQAISYVRTIGYLGATGGGNETPVPEASTILLLGLGLIGLAGSRRKKIKTN